MTILEMLAGGLLGLVILAHGRLTRRRVRVWLFVVCLLGIAFTIKYAVAWYSFVASPRRLHFFLEAHVATIIAWLALAFAASKKVESNREQPEEAK
jgi:hypothetical protein